jgi:phosphomannomutase
MTTKTAVLLDIDNTLTPPRQELTRQMAEVLKGLCVPFHVAAGSDIGLLQEQFFGPLYKFGFRGRFDAFLANGAIHYRCDYSGGMSIELVSEFNIREYLDDSDYRFMIDVLKKTLELPRFEPLPPLRIMGERIIDRGAMINFCPVGRVNQESAESLRNRNNFVEFDRRHGYRQEVIAHLKRELSSLINNRHLRITLGGQTSFDIGIANQDKANAVRTLLKEGIEKVVFIGDALFDGGNDAPIKEFAKNWPSTSPCPIETIQVSAWEETIEKLHELGFVCVRAE